MRAGEGAVNLADQLHVVEEGIEGIEVGEAHHVGRAASRGLERDAKSVSSPARDDGTKCFRPSFAQTDNVDEPG